MICWIFCSKTQLIFSITQPQWRSGKSLQTNNMCWFHPENVNPLLYLTGKSDDILVKVLEKLKVSVPTEKSSIFINESRVLVPYDVTGKRSNQVKMWLDLSTGAKVKLTDGHNCQVVLQNQENFITMIKLLIRKKSNSLKKKTEQNEKLLKMFSISINSIDPILFEKNTSTQKLMQW